MFTPFWVCGSIIFFLRVFVVIHLAVWSSFRCRPSSFPPRFCPEPFLFVLNQFFSLTRVSISTRPLARTITSHHTHHFLCYNRPLPFSFTSDVYGAVLVFRCIIGPGFSYVPTEVTYTHTRPPWCSEDLTVYIRALVHFPIHHRIDCSLHPFSLST